MIAILDPALLLTNSPVGPLPPEEERALSALVDDVARICRAHGARIPTGDQYWRKLQTEMVRPLHKRAREPRLRQGLDAWQRFAQNVALAPIPPGKKRFWGVKPLFDWPPLANDWLGIMEGLLVGCAALREKTVIITRLFAGRNMERRSLAQSTVTVKTRWRLSLQMAGQAPHHIPCVRNPRNLATSWTTRFDEKLPDTGTYPFCPPPAWWRRDVKAHDTVESKPAWIDRYGGGWAQPTTGGDHHWDVFIRDPNLEAAVGINPINVVAWGNTEGKTPGEIHHIPKNKKAHFRGGGWTCPGDV